MTQYTCIHKNASPQLATNDLKYASMNIETAWLSSEQGGNLALQPAGIRPLLDDGARAFAVVGGGDGKTARSAKLHR